MRRRTPAQRVQHVLHRTRRSARPSSWCSSCVSCSPRSTTGFARPPNAVAARPAGRVVGRPRRRADADHPDRRHRPVGRARSRSSSLMLAKLGCGQRAFRHRSRCWSAIVVGVAAGSAQRPAGHPDRPAAVHRHAGHVEHLHRDRAAVRQGPERPALDLPDLLSWTGETFAIGGFRDDHRRGPGGAAVRRRSASRCATPRGAGTSTPSATTPRPPGWPASAVDRVLFSVYAVAGAIYGLAAWILIGRAGAASPNAIANANLEASPRS